MAQQTERQVEVITPLGDDVLLFHQMTAKEELGRLFHFDLDLLSKNPDLKFEDLLGQNVTVRLDLPEDKKRYFNGIVSRFSQEGSFEDFNAYSMSLDPWLWFLTRTADCRIFQEKTVPDIIKEIFRDHGFTDFEEALSGTYRTWEYCVQYRETDFNFVSRLMEQEGIYYYFKHEINKHIMVLSDSISAHEVFPGYEKLPYFPPDGHLRRERDHIYDWNISKEVQTGVYALEDYDFKKPKANLEVKSIILRDHTQANMEIFDYPGEYIQTGDGETYARTRIEEIHAGYEKVYGQGNARGLSVGSLFTLTDYPRQDQNREYLIVSANHQVMSDAYSSVIATAPEDVYNCNFTALESKQPFRPARSTPKPMVQGPQTAVVVGKAGEEIWTDNYGRVKIQFHWDRYGKLDENSSCWVRVSHPTAGSRWGAVQIPRIGQEVIVDFLEGDPDHPIITGRVYNNDNMPPYDLPGKDMVSGMKSNSTPGGGGYNEISMDDSKGKEMITVHAQKDMATTAENNRTATIKSGNDAITVQSGTRSVTVKGDTTLTVQAGSRIVSVTGGDYSVKASDAVLMKGAGKGVGIEGSGGKGVEIKGKGSDGVGISGNPNFVAVGETEARVYSKDVLVHADSSVSISVGGSQIEVTASAIKISGSSSVEIKGGGGTVKLDAGGVKVSGGMVKINC